MATNSKWAANRNRTRPPTCPRKAGLRPDAPPSHCPGVRATTRPNRSRLCSLSSSGGEGWGEEASFHISSKLGAITPPPSARRSAAPGHSCRFACQILNQCHLKIALFPRCFCPVFEGGVYYSLRPNHLQNHPPPTAQFPSCRAEGFAEAGLSPLRFTFYALRAAFHVSGHASRTCRAGASERRRVTQSTHRHLKI
jgi:hypothetical protein